MTAARPGEPAPPLVRVAPRRDGRGARLLMTGLVGGLRLGRGVCLVAQACAVLAPWPAAREGAARPVRVEQREWLEGAMSQIGAPAEVRKV